MADRSLRLVIVGGGPAGISTALHVAHRDPALAERMVVLEKEHYPRDKYCAGAVAGRALHTLAAIGVEVPCVKVPIEAMSLSFAGGRVVVRVPDLGVTVRRIEFDHALAVEAMKRGIQVRQGAVVQSVEVGEHGVTIRLADGEVLETPVVVGADGVTSVVRRGAGFPRATLRAQVIECDTEIVDSDPPWDDLHFDFSNPELAGYVWDFPTQVNGRRMMCRGVYGLQHMKHRENARARLEVALAQRGLEMANYKLKPFVEHGFLPDAAISRPRVLLVGEAAGIDIFSGEGIAQAIQYGALVGPYLADAFARSDFGFGDWLERVASAELGVTLARRYGFHHRLYGESRSTMEELLVLPAVTRLGALRFAGKPIGRMAVARALAQVATRAGPRLARRWLRSRFA
jgi:flavin-dependent dehydrogenase